jgi:hypothetical protein
MGKHRNAKLKPKLSFYFLFIYFIQDPNFAIDPSGEFIFTVLIKNLLAFNAHTGENVLNVKAHTREVLMH